MSGRGLCTAGRLAGVGHPDLAIDPGASMLDRLTRPWVLGPSRLEEVEDVLGARCRPESEELVVCIGEGPAAAHRHEARVADLREDHALTPITCIRSIPVVPSGHGGGSSNRYTRTG